MKRLRHFLDTWRTCTELRFSLLNRFKFILAASHGLATWLPLKLGIRTVEVRLKERGRLLHLPLRLNGVDYTLVREIFGRGLYDAQADNVRTILDLGGNIGVATLFLHARFTDATIATVEPVTQNIQILEETVRLNNIPATIFAAAVGIEDGSAVLHPSSDPTAGSLTPSSDSGESITVQQVSVPTIMKKMAWNQIDFLKVDIEGYEKILLSSKNDWLNSVNVIVGEAHGHAKYGLEDVIRDLAPFGFRVSERSRDPVYELVVFEARRYPT
jgi:FkbM family methyltransferase